MRTAITTYFLGMNAASLKGRMQDWRNFITIATQRCTCAVVSEQHIVWNNKNSNTDVGTARYLAKVG